MSKLLLSACNVQELSIGGLEHGHTKGNEDVHHPKNYRARKVCTKRVRPDADSSVDMEGTNSCEKKGKFSHANGRKLAMPADRVESVDEIST